MALRKFWSRPDPPSPTHESELLPHLHDSLLTSGDKTVVLDVGSGCPGTLNFFAAYGCRVVFLDLAAPQRDEADPGRNENAFQTALAPYEGTLFDICFFADLLHKLPATGLRELSQALLPHIYSRTRGLGICDMAASSDAHRRHYRIAGANHFDVTTTRATLTGAWSFTGLARNFDCLRVSSDRLTPDGCLEYLLLAE